MHPLIWAVSVPEGVGSEAAVAGSLLVILASASVVALVMQRLRLAPIPAFLITGALIGPNALEWVRAPEALAGISRLAVILMLFGIGLELHLSALRHGLWRMVLAGLGSCALTVLAGWPVCMLFGLSSPSALAVSMALSMSSTAVVLRLLSSRREMRLSAGRMALAILVLQDLIVLGMLAALPALALWDHALRGIHEPHLVSPAAHDWAGLALEIVLRLAGVAAVIVVGRLLLPWLMRESLRARSLDVLLITGVAVTLLAAEILRLLGFSLEMGAFMAGFLLAGTPFRHQLAGQIGPLRDLFIAVFFTTLGMQLDPAAVAAWWWVVLLGVAVLLAVKAVLIGGTCLALGATAGTAAAVGLFLSQAGEFSLILLDEAAEQGLLSQTVLGDTIAVVVISLMVTPGLVTLGVRVREALLSVRGAPWGRPGGAPLAESDEGTAVPGQHVVVAGYGPVGRLVCGALGRAGIHYTVIELNPTTVREQARQGRSFVFGDVSNPDVLDYAGIWHASALILTIPDDDAVLRACAVARRSAPELFIAARLSMAARTAAGYRQGADLVTVDEMATAETMVAAMMARVGLGPAARDAAAPAPPMDDGPGTDQPPAAA